MPDLEERVTTLEADAFRSNREAHRRAEALGALSATASHLRDGLDTVSADVRELAHEVRTELVPRIDRLETKLDLVQRGVADLLKHFDLPVPGDPHS